MKKSMESFLDKNKRESKFISKNVSNDINKEPKTFNDEIRKTLLVSIPNPNSIMENTNEIKTIGKTDSHLTKDKTKNNKRNHSIDNLEAKGRSTGKKFHFLKSGYVWSPVILKVLNMNYSYSCSKEELIEEFKTFAKKEGMIRSKHFYTPKTLEFMNIIKKDFVEIGRAHV